MSGMRPARNWPYYYKAGQFGFAAPADQRQSACNRPDSQQPIKPESVGMVPGAISGILSGTALFNEEYHSFPEKNPAG